MATKYKYSVVVTNKYLGKQKEVKSYSREDCEMMANVQLEKWKDEERRAREREKQRLEAERKKELVEEHKSLAETRNQEAKEEIEYIRTTLSRCAELRLQELWGDLYDHEEYPEFSFRKQPTMKQAIEIVGGIPKKKVTDFLFKSKLETRQRQENAASSKHQEMLTQYSEELASEREKYEKEKASFYKQRDRENTRLYKIGCLEGSDKEDLLEFTVIAASLFSQLTHGFVLPEPSLSPDASVMLFDIEFPGIEEIPAVKGYKYVAARDEIDAIPFKQAELENLYEHYIFSTVVALLALMHEPLMSKGVEMIAVNAWSSGIDKSTGKEKHSCILSLTACCEDLRDMNFASVEPKACVRGLKGVYAGSLSSLTAVAPLVTFKTDDPRFVQSKEVIAAMDPNQNLATMDWQDFEHLIRELFDKEFGSSEGSEVKVTQASRDAGVDAIAFDPDPIRGGKFVIQAKRYNNVVGVSNVRDLYGTIMNEGASKGILVTTSYFGSDSYEFAKDKPITLVDGSGLLSLLERHKYPAFNITLQRKDD